MEQFIDSTRRLLHRFRHSVHLLHSVSIEKIGLHRLVPARLRIAHAGRSSDCTCHPAMGYFGPYCGLPSAVLPLTTAYDPQVLGRLGPKTSFDVFLGSLRASLADAMAPSHGRGGLGCAPPRPCTSGRRGLQKLWWPRQLPQEPFVGRLVLYLHEGLSLSHPNPLILMVTTLVANVGTSGALLFRQCSVSRAGCLRRHPCGEAVLGASSGHAAFPHRGLSSGSA